MSSGRVVVPPWQPDWPLDVRDRFIRVSAAHVRGDSRWECPEHLAFKARPAVYLERAGNERVTYPPFNAFPLGLVRDAAYSVLARSFDAEAALAEAISSATRGDTTVHEATAQVAREGLQGYLISLARLRDTGQLPPETVVREFYAVDEADADGVRVEWSAWGLLHVDRTTGLREFHILTWDNAGDRHRSEAYLAVYARVASDAVMQMDNLRPYHRREAAQHQPAPGTHVRIREFGILDGTDAVLVDTTPDEVRESFPTVLRDAVHTLSGGTYNPGGGCASCALREVCPALPRMPGVFGLAGSSPWLRSLSPGDLTAARVCTWQVQLQRELSLPRARRETTAAMHRGAQLHSWLEHAHGRFMPCSVDDIPLPGDGIGEIADRLGWSSEQYAALRPYLLAHQGACPLGGDDVVEVRPEQSLTAWDTDANVIISTRADLVLHIDDTFIVRETKTVGEEPAEESMSALLERYPQVAVTVCMLADGLNPMTGSVEDATAPAVVQLEVLWPGGQVIHTFDTADAETVLIARGLVAQAVDTIVYAEPTPNPGRWCAWCPVSSWCIAAEGASQSATTVVEESTILASDSPEAMPSRVSLLAYAEATSDVEDDVPY